MTESGRQGQVQYAPVGPRGYSQGDNGMGANNRVAPQAVASTSRPSHQRWAQQQQQQQQHQQPLMNAPWQLTPSASTLPSAQYSTPQSSGSSRSPYSSTSQPSPFYPAAPHPWGGYYHSIGQPDNRQLGQSFNQGSNAGPSKQPQSRVTSTSSQPPQPPQPPPFDAEKHARERIRAQVEDTARARSFEDDDIFYPHND
ncbi:hypothetical protein F5Y08DRAFT_296734 [Xylaria arbuscula]|nr:hypothetical protein F5Y08DRAFT_296734 [Xylaria arbuscula]